MREPTEDQWLADFRSQGGYRVVHRHHVEEINWAEIGWVIALWLAAIGIIVATLR